MTNLHGGADQPTDLKRNAAIVSLLFAERPLRSNLDQQFLGDVLTHPAGEIVAAQLEPQNPNHRKLVQFDQLSRFLGDKAKLAFQILSDGRAKDFLTAEPVEAQKVRDVLDTYERVFGPYVIEIYEKFRSEGQEQRSFPLGFCSGLQGVLHGHIIARHLLEARLALDANGIAAGIVQGRFSRQFFQKHGIGGLLNTNFGNSPPRFVYTTLKNHPSPEMLSYFEDLELRHFASVSVLWTSRSKPRDSDWEFDPRRNCWLNLHEARLATKEVVHAFIGIPCRHDHFNKDYIESIERLISGRPHEILTQERFKDTPGLFGRRYEGMLAEVYKSSIPHLLIDFLLHHPSFLVRDHFKNLEPYHFSMVNKTGVADETFRRYSRQAFHELAGLLTDPRGSYGWDIQDLPSLVEGKMLKGTKLRYGATVFPYVSGYQSKVHAWIDYLKNHPDEEIRGYFKDLKPYHFKKAPLDTWSFRGDKSQKPQEPGWGFQEADGKWKNFRLARQAFGEFLVNVHKNIPYLGDFEKLPGELALEELEGPVLLYGASLHPMIRAVYGMSLRAAFADFITSPEFEQVFNFDSRIHDQVVKKFGSMHGYQNYVLSTLRDRRGKQKI